MGIDSGRILNYEKMKKYKSCKFLEDHCYLPKDYNLRFCCSDFGRNISPLTPVKDTHEETI